MSKIQERLKEVFAQPLERGVMANIARKCDVSRPTVTAWFNLPEKVASISRSHAEIICAEYNLNVSPAWLAEGIGPKLLPAGVHHVIAEHTNVEPAPDLKKSRRVPITGSVKGGDDGYLVQDNGIDGWVDYWTSDPQAHALRIKGDSMHPRYRAGEFVIVTPSVEAQPGRDVVVKLTNGKCLLKQLNWMRDDEVQLLSINNGYAPMTISRSEIETIARVAGSVGPDSMVF
ncbi:S24 family peptidase [Comamonas terrigena]|uniref:S24 family peptidase n=1 Tax=Comamonas terrigena TaxID=32013 RepID=UPI00289DF058|nr:S24 family peptidase [Comamonas terrigena]